MEANQFVRNYGWDKAKEFSQITIKGLKQDYCFEINTGESIGLAYVNLKDLKCLVDSYDLVQVHGLEQSKEIVKNAPSDDAYFSWTLGSSGIRDKTVHIGTLRKAISDVESCQ